jgi:small subunit ribosomal protein S1
MVTKKKPIENHVAPFDEGWWASVLADEEHFAQPVVSKPQRTDAQLRATPDWEQAKDLYHKDEVVAMQVTGFNRGGLLVEGDGLYGFVPYSHLVEMSASPESGDRDASLAAYLNRQLELKIIECVPEDGRIVFSERAALAGAGQRPQLFRRLQPGKRVSGEVTNITDFGVFVDLGGVEGLVHISELSWGRVGHPRQIAELGEIVEVLVLEVSQERSRVALSLKRLLPNPWERAETYYAVNQIIPAEITAIVSYGAFARLEDGLEGLIHASEMPLGGSEAVKDLLTPGQQVRVRILHVDAAHQRLGLSLRLAE